jgi:hypothetical protein
MAQVLGGKEPASELGRADPGGDGRGGGASWTAAGGGGRGESRWVDLGNDTD